MNRVPFRRAAALAALALVPLLASGCNKKLSIPSVTAERPTVRLSAAPIDTIGPDGKRSHYIYHYKMNWVGYDVDGRVDHFLYTIDPPGSPGGGRDGIESECGKPSHGDTAWCTTKLNEKEIFFSAAVPDSINFQDPRASQIHTFVIKAVDNDGLVSAPVYRSFFSNTQAPIVQIDEPSPNGLLYALVSPFITIHWHGDDPDGVFTQKPVKYKFKLLKDTDPEFNFDLALQDADALRRFYAPTFPGWDSTSADTTFATFTNLIPNSRYLFALIGIDEAGAYSPIFNLSSSLLKMLVTFAGNNGPKLTIFNEFFNYTYPSGGFSLDPSRYVNLEIPARQPVHFNWSAEAPRGSIMKQYRWSMDMTNLDDQTPRSDERTDVKHWSQWGLSNTSTTLGPFPSDTTHTLFIEAEDVNGLVSLGIIAFRIVVPTFNHELLIVNDTRLLPDNAVNILKPDSLQPPPSTWPSRAELDTFLFARGGVRWRMTPTGTMTPPGVFAGYRYDTIYTAAGTTNGVVSLDTLGRYQHVIWITEPSAANGIGALGPGVLRVMSGVGRANTLAAYSILGGRVWLLGGAAVQATMLPWNVANNDRDPPFGVQKFSVTPVPGRAPEIAPGRFVYDLPHWRSDIWIYGINNAFPHKSIRAVGGYPSRMDPRWGFVRSPDYSALPTRLGLKSLVSDPFPPYRNASSFYNAVSVYNFEFLTPANPAILVNQILEDDNPDPDTTHLVSMLDTLMIVPLRFTGIPNENEDLTLGGRNYISFPVMTYYHGFESAPFVLSGFDLWSFSKPDMVGLVDFVLQQIWGLPKESARAAASPVPSAPTAARLRR